ncbi:hypothetical protein [Microcystis phage Mel-JY34]
MAGLRSGAELLMLASKIGLLGGSRTLVISSNQTNFNLHTALGSPAAPVRALVIINPGVVISSDNSSTPAFDEGALPTGSFIHIINNGSLRGMGGAGGAGGNVSSAGIFDDTASPAGNGGAGGTALRLTARTQIANAAGEIFGGGGGGGGSGGWINSNLDPDQIYGIGGSGGGGGQSEATAAAGSGGTAGGASVADTQYLQGNPGTIGSASAAGTGGAAKSIIGQSTAVGAAGGAWGASGATAAAGPASFGLKGSPGSGGAGGKAVDVNGQTLTWLSGNDGARVKGAVS